MEETSAHATPRKLIIGVIKVTITRYSLGGHTFLPESPQHGLDRVYLEPRPSATSGDCHSKCKTSAETFF